MSAQTTVFRDVRIFDGSHILAEDTVVVQNAIIATVGKNLPTPPGATIVDGIGQTLLPGLIDAHTHTFGPALQQALIFGVTTELDMFTDWRLAKTLKEQQAAGLGQDLPDLRSAGTAITVPGGHGTEFGLTIPTLNDPGDALDFVDTRLAEGSDYIKIMYDDGKNLGRSLNNMSKATLAVVVAAAHLRGKLAVVHIMAYDAARDAIDAGADVLAHLFFDREADADFGKWLAERHASVISTLTLLDSITGGAGGTALTTDAWLTPYLTGADIDLVNKRYPPFRFDRSPGDVIQGAMRQLKVSNVSILAGTDASMPGSMHGASLHRELELLVKAGLAPVDALAAATSVPASIFGLADRGRIAPGLRADLVLVEGDPSNDILATRHITGVWKQGVAIDRHSYRERVERERDEAEHRRANTSHRLEKGKGTRMTTRIVTIEHNVVAADRPYDQVIRALDARLGQTPDWEEITRASKRTNPSWEQIVQFIEQHLGTSGFTVFSKIDPGALLALKDRPVRAAQYAIGNPLLAIQMIEHAPEAALYAPLRLVVYEDQAGKTFIAYECFSSQLAQYPDPEIAPVAQLVEEKLEALVAEVATVGKRKE